MLELNKIYNMDCLEGMKLIDDKSIDMILCDLPYGTTACKWDSIIPLDILWNQYKRIIKDNGAIVLTSTQPFTTELIHSNLDMFRYEWIWDKKKPTGWLWAKKQPMRQHENVLVFYKKQPTYNPQPYIKNTVGYLSDKESKTFVETLGMEKGRTSNNENSEGYPRSIINCIPVLNNLTKDKAGLHPTQKPIALFEYLIKTYTNEGETVLDNCIGSGTTAIACINTNRNYIGFEIDPDYYEAALERIRIHMQQQTIFELL